MATDSSEGGLPADWAAPSPRLRTLRRAEVAAVGLAVAVVAVVISLLASTWGVAVICVVGTAVAAGVADLFVGRRVRAWGFAERGDDLLVRRGVMFQRLSVIPYGRMQFVDVTAGPLERSFGLATVQMHTAAAASDARIPGLERIEADRLRDQLTALGESHAAGL